MPPASSSRPWKLASSSAAITAERSLIALALLQALGDALGSEGMGWNYALAVLGLASLHAGRVAGLQLTLWGTAASFIADIVFLATGAGGAKATGVQAAGACAFIVKVVVANYLFVTITGEYGASADPRFYGREGADTAAPLDPASSPGLPGGAGDGDEEGGKGAPTSFQASGSYQS